MSPAPRSDTRAPRRGDRPAGARRDRPAGPRDQRARRPARRPTRRQILVRRWTVLLIIVLLPVLGYAVTFTSLLGVRHVEVAGTRTVTPEQVRAAAAIPQGSPMLRLDLPRIRDRVAALPRVAAVEVDRSWPGTVWLRVEERTPVGVIRTPDGAHLVDRTGRDYATVPDPPSGVPELELARAAPDDRVTMAVVGVLAAVPDRVRPEVISVGAGSPGSVVLHLSGGREVRWGGVESSARKAAVLQVLLSRDGSVYDVSSPELPTVS